MECTILFERRSFSAPYSPFAFARLPPHRTWVRVGKGKHGPTSTRILCEPAYITRAPCSGDERTSEATKELLEWPFHLGAPVVDGDDVPDNYNFTGGDRPALVGDQMHWWVMNDAGNRRTWMQSPPLPLELRMSALTSIISTRRARRQD